MTEPTKTDPKTDTAKAVVETAKELVKANVDAATFLAGKPSPFKDMKRDGRS